MKHCNSSCTGHPCQVRPALTEGRARVQSSIVKASNKTNRTVLIKVLVLACIVGTLGWDLTERIVRVAGLSLSLQAGPVGFDIGVIQLYVRSNPGTLLGIPAGFLVFRNL